jgi:hypothetical protein
MNPRFLFFILLVTISLTACGGEEIVGQPDEGFFRPATQAAISKPTLLPDLENKEDTTTFVPAPTSTPACNSNLYFLSDLTIPDGTLVEPGETLDKRWEVQNNGTCNWDNRYQIRLIAGPGMGVPVQQALVPALSGTTTMIRMVYIAPDEPGYYRSAWQAFDPELNPFGDPFFIDIVVQVFDENELDLGGE